MPLPRLDLETFARRLQRVAPEPLSPGATRALWAHYEVLVEWGRGLSLIGPGTEAEAVERHYGESLAPLPWVGPAGWGFACFAIILGGIYLGASIRFAKSFDLVSARRLLRVSLLYLPILFAGYLIAVRLQ